MIRLRQQEIKRRRKRRKEKERQKGLFKRQIKQPSAST
jgi:hypothetical protein